MVRQLGLPSFFITITTNPNWPELQRIAHRCGLQSWEMVVYSVRLFYAKMDVFFDMVLKKDVSYTRVTINS